MRGHRAVAAIWAIAASACPSSGPEAPVITAVVPAEVEGGAACALRIEGEGLDAETRVLLGQRVLRGTLTADGALEVTAPALRRGRAQLWLKSRAGTSAPAELAVRNSAPALHDPGLVLLEVGHPLRLPLTAHDFDGDPTQITVSDLPPGARWHEVDQRLSFTPRAAQGDRLFEVTVTTTDGLDRVTQSLLLEVVPTPPPMVITALSPRPAPGGVPFTLEVRGAGFTSGAQLHLDGAPLVTALVSSERLLAEVPVTRRGVYAVTAVGSGDASAPLKLAVTNAPPTLTVVEAVTVDEEAETTIKIQAEDMEQDALRLGVLELPPGARFDEASGELTFRPDFIQGGRSYAVRATARDGADTSTATFTITVQDTLQPPAPVVTRQSQRRDHLQLELTQTTDAFLDSPRQAGRTFTARVVIPLLATVDAPRPVRVFLHGFGGEPFNGGEGDQFRIYPHDPDNTYWWGHSAQAPEAAGAGPVPPYTVRRTLHLLAWVLANYPGADPERVYLHGSSMGGTGAALMGLLWARHFALAEATLGQTIARAHRPSRIAQLSPLWGAPEANLPDELGGPVWDRLDLVRALVESREAREQFIFTRHAKDDPIIHFGAAVLPSPRVGLSWLDALQRHHVGHLAVWDEGGHGPPDPVLGPDWWGAWDRIEDPVSSLARNQAFVAFSRSDADEDPGDGRGDGRAFDPERGYAGEVSIPGDTGWSGAVAGVRNRYLRWDSRFIVDTWARLEIPLRAAVGIGEPPPRPRYPPRGHQLDRRLPIHADVTPRRVQAFRCQPGELVRWAFADRAGEVTAGPDGEVTVPQLPISHAWTPLVLTRARR